MPSSKPATPPVDFQVAPVAPQRIFQEVADQLTAIQRAEKLPSVYQRRRAG